MADNPVEPDSAPASRAHSRPVALYLFALVLAILLPAMAVALVLLNRTNDAQQDVLRALTSTTVQAMGQSVDRELAGMATTLRVLSTSGFLRGGDLREFNDRSVEALAGTGAYLLAVDANFHQLLNTRVAFGTVLGRTSDPDTARRTLQRGVATVSGLFFGQTAKAFVFNVWLPVRQSGAVQLLALTQNAQNLQQTLQTRQLPQGWHAALVDGNNLVVASTTDTGIETGANLPLRQTATTQTSEWLQESFEGQDVVTAEWRSAIAGWRLIAWAPAALVQRPLQESLLQLAAWGLVIAIAAAAVAFLIAQRIGLSVKGLRLDAARLGRGEAVYPRSYPVTEIAEVSAALASASEQRQMAERDNRFLMRELAHRSKNQMAVIAAMAKQTARGATDVPTYVVALERRIMGLARSTDLLLAHGRAGVMLAELVDQQLAPFRPSEESRLRIEGPEIRINPQGAQILGMALHELATNATRFGAFSDPGGRLALVWRVTADELVLDWRETLSAPLVDTDRSGFGTIVLRSMVGGALGAQVERKAHADGVQWRFAIPLSALDPAFAAARPDEPAPGQ